MKKLDKILEEAFNSVDFDQYKKAYEFNKDVEKDEEAKALEEAFNSVDFEQYEVPYTCECSCGSSCTCNNCSCDKEDYVDYDTIVNMASLMFSSEVVDRGEEYYHNGNVINVFRDGNKFYAKVINNEGKVYRVKIDFKSHMEIETSCDCPCEFNCKHEYAAMCAILNEEYTNISLKNYVDGNDCCVYELLSKIPAEEFKNYCLNEGIDSVAIEENAFKSFFKKYMPVEGYEYYYNNLYNELSLHENVDDLLNEYYSNMKEFIDINNFKEVIKIVKAIVNAFKDSGNLNTVQFIGVIRDISMFYRVAYNNASDVDKKEFNMWNLELTKSNFYNNYYLQDMINSIM